MSARPAARTGDVHACPQLTERPSPHIGGPITDGSPDVFINGAPAARAGDGTACDGPPGQVASGSPGVFINRQSAARIADPAGHGGRIARGSPDVHIGDHGGRSSGRPTGHGQAVGQTRAVVLHADYDRDGGMQSSAAEHRARLTRPGAIVLANLDIDAPRRNPPVATSTAAERTRVPHLDAYQPDPPPGDGDVSPCALAESPYGPVSATRIDLVLHPVDANRVRVFRDQNGPLILGIEGRMRQPSDRPSTIGTFEIAASETLPLPLRMEAVTLPGDPLRGGAGGAGPQPPSDPFAGTRPPGANDYMLYDERAPGEVWMEVEHTGGGQVRRDVSLFTIAPFLLVPNTEPVERLYVVYTGSRPLSTHPFVYDLSVACRAIFGGGVDVPSSPGARFSPHTPCENLNALAGKRVVVMQSYGSSRPGRAEERRDSWIQDQVLIGYCRAPHATMHMVVQCKRSGLLGVRAREDFAVDGVGLWEGLLGPSEDGQDWGGNIEVSPPVRAAMPADVPRDAAGPSFRRHPPAPFGKIVFGDCSPRPAHDETRAFLLAQRVQPVLPIDTSWLQVGHVDEIMTTVPDGRGGFKLLVASARAMTQLLLAARSVARPDRTAFHRGRFDECEVATDRHEYPYAELEVEDLLDTPVSRSRDPRLLRQSQSGRAPTVTVRAYNDALQNAKLRPIAARLRDGLGLTDADVIPLPMYFRVPTAHSAHRIAQRDERHITSSLTVALVNLQVVNGHLLVPRPLGPRLPPRAAQDVLARALPNLGLGHLSVRLGSTESVHWSPPDEPSGRVYAYFARLTPEDRAAVVAELNANGPTFTQPTGMSFLPISPAGEAAIRASRSSIQASNPGDPTLDAGGGTSSSWRRILVSEGTVDLIESFVLTVIEPLGLRVEFIDAWNHHIGVGSLHCATNVQRTPPSARWWEDGYQPVGPHWRYDPAR